MVTSVQPVLKRQTDLITVYGLEDPEEGPREISAPNKQGLQLMIIPNAPDCCWFKFNVPEGMISLESSWGQHNGQLTPGFQLCYCAYKQVTCMISLNTLRMNCPILRVPTKDNVRVNIDVGINFHIGQSEDTYEEDAMKFFYKFSPARLEELLVVETEEEIRGFMKTIKIAKVHDVKSEITSVVLKNLYAKFIVYGVVIECVNIMAVVIPEDLRLALNYVTNYDVYLQKQVK